MKLQSKWEKNTNVTKLANDVGI